jgi:hypothetical protein
VSQSAGAAFVGSVGGQSEAGMIQPALRAGLAQHIEDYPLWVVIWL